MLKRIFLYTGNQDMKFDCLPRRTASAGSKFSNIYMFNNKTSLPVQMRVHKHNKNKTPQRHGTYYER